MSLKLSHCHTFVPTLLHKRSYAEPQTVLKCELVLDFTRVLRAWIGIVPLIRTEPRCGKQHQANAQVSQQNIDPDRNGEGFEEGEQTRVGGFRFLEDDADAEVHEWFGEVNHLLSDPTDSQ